MSDKPKSSFWRFWTTLRGVLTGLAALLSALVAAVTLFNGGSHAAGSPSPPAKTGTTVTSTGTSPTVTTGTSPTVVPDQHAWVTELTAMCREEGLNAQAREAADNAKPGEVAQLEIEATAMLSLDRQLRASTAPPQDEVKLLKMTADWDGAAGELQDLATAHKENEKVLAEEHEKRFNEDNELGNELAHGLGLDVCALTSF
jgi:hypothetical protein